MIAAPAAIAQSAGGDVSASAEREPDHTPARGIAYGALPGGLHVPSAETLDKGVVEVSTLSGFGYRKGLLGTNHRFGRAIGDLAAAYGITDTFSLGLSLDGRYDRHYGLNPSGDDGYVGDPHLNARLAHLFGAIRAGAQLGIWVPGKNAPSIAGSAISVDVRGLVSLAAGPGLLSFDAGFRIDNSANSVDNAAALSLQDRVSLGVSNYNAVFGGAHLVIPTGESWIGLEASIDAFIGSAPSGQADLAEGKMIVRAGGQFGIQLNAQWSALAFLELAKVPGILAVQVMNNAIPLIPYEPVFTGGLGLQARFGGPGGASYVEKDCHRHVPPDCAGVKVPVLADISGTVVDSAQKPVVGAKVTLVLKNSQVPATATDDKGKYELKGVPIGSSIDNKPTIEETGIQVNVSVSNMKPGKATLTSVVEGANTIAPIQLDPVLPPGQLRGVVRSVPGGKAVAGAKIVVSPGDAKGESGADGTFTIDLPPGQYKISVTSAGWATQDLDVTIDPNGVAIKNIELHK